MSIRHEKRYIRYLVLLLILLAISGHSLYVRSKVASWDEALLVRVIPINGDGSEATETYIQSLRQESVEDIAEFINAEARRYGVSSEEVITILLGEEIGSIPPEPSREQTYLRNILWSISFRAWARWQLFVSGHWDGDIAVFVRYFDPARFSSLTHSIGLRKGMIGLVNAYANQTYEGSNNVIIVHELLHTLGATDKYDTTNNNPLFPIGFARPGKVPLYPQSKAEIMGGRIPVSARESVIPSDLDAVLIGEATALELQWLPHQRGQQ